MDQFGKQRLKDFQVDASYINVNHGSYGLCAKVVLQQQLKLRIRTQFNPQKWFREDAFELYSEARAYVASKVNCAAKNLFLVTNATEAFNNLVKSLHWQEGDIILLPNTAYGSIRKTIQYLRDFSNITILDLNFTLEDMQTEQSFQMRVQDFINGFPKKIKLAVFDHIISIPGYICPVDSLVQFFKEKRIPLFIDGAHAMNQVYVNMGDLQPDAYFSNFNKWAYAPKNSAFLYLSDKYVDIVKPVVTANYYGSGPERQFFWTGTKDLTAHMCIRKGLQYSQSFGNNAVRSYCHNLAMRAGKRVAQIWGTRLINSDERTVGFMINVEVPESDLSLCSKIALQMLKEVNCFPVFLMFDGKVYSRLSAQLYNQLSDFEYMANNVLIYLQKHRAATKKQAK